LILKQCLVPTLKPGDLFLPAYSPDFSPIQHGVFAKLKRLLRKAAKRTAEETWKGIGKLLNPFTPGP